MKKAPNAKKLDEIELIKKARNESGLSQSSLGFVLYKKLGKTLTEAACQKRIQRFENRKVIPEKAEMRALFQILDLKSKSQKKEVKRLTKPEQNKLTATPQPMPLPTPTLDPPTVARASDFLSLMENHLVGIDFSATIGMLKRRGQGTVSPQDFIKALGIATEISKRLRGLRVPAKAFADIVENNLE
jgi:hypothetical protein